MPQILIRKVSNQKLIAMRIGVDLKILIIHMSGMLGFRVNNEEIVVFFSLASAFGNKLHQSYFKPAKFRVTIL